MGKRQQERTLETALTGQWTGRGHNNVELRSDLSGWKPVCTGTLHCVSLTTEDAVM